MDIRILGPIEARDHGEQLPLGGAKQRALLALLILHRGETISIDRLVDELWDERPPPSAQKSVHVYVSHLRKVLGRDAVATHGHGYALDVDPAALDVEQFDALVADGRRLLAGDDPGGAADTLRAALALWHGPPLADFRFDAFASSEIARLEELRMAALGDRIDADLELGCHAELVPELEALTREEPLRERLHEQLMLALYRSGRQAEALEVYRRIRSRLGAELGLAPGPGLREREHAILGQAPALDPPPRRRIAARLATQHRAATGRRLVAAGVTLVALLGFLVLTRSDSGRRARATLAPTSIGRIDARSGHVQAAVRLAGDPARIAAGRGAVWVASAGSHTLAAVSAHMRVTRFSPAPGRLSDIAVGQGAVWTLDGSAGTVTRLSPASGAATRPVRLSGRRDARTAARRSGARSPWSIASGAGGVWVTDGSERLHVIDPRRARITAVLHVRERLNGVAIGAGAVWAISGRASEVLRVDPRTRMVTDRIRIVSRPGVQAPYPVAVEAGAGSVWVLNANSQTVTRIDPRARGIVATIPIGIGRGALRLAASGGFAWVASDDGTLSRIDARTNAVRAFTLGPGLRDVGVAGGAVWVTTGPRQRGAGSRRGH